MQAPAATFHGEGFFVEKEKHIGSGSLRVLFALSGKKKAQVAQKKSCALFGWVLFFCVCANFSFELESGTKNKT